ncbi:helix-turn-helix domain-containing protein, partial [Enterococcus faecium]
SQYAFPGNIRELEHAIEREIILSESDFITLKLENTVNEGAITSLNIEEMEEKLINNALKKYHGNISAAADTLGLSRA